MAEDLFEMGLCLPSGTAMTDDDLNRVIGTILKSRAEAAAKSNPPTNNNQTVLPISAQGPS